MSSTAKFGNFEPSAAAAASSIPGQNGTASRSNVDANLGSMRLNPGPDM
eukprot:CAMPEP_0196251152 /NCGR_PEP_ID=MMETSP0913-20130531/46822_1 /TAXON_ID=49265 /ORGANISM="Thalassiosira rotula, Strain GSO102" /LENGTH=48 /DNA_ID= /DNA_START= /DNA_END= /DNA_ORIENTATION=